MRRISTAEGLAAAVVVVVLGSTYFRLYFGVDFTDEAFYVAVAHRFVEGARPLLDETIVAQQPAAVLLYPFILLWHALAGVEGLILYARHLHFALSVVAALVLFRALAVWLGDRAVRAVVAVGAVAFVPFGLHAVSYNTLGSGLFTLGLFLGAASLVSPARTLIAGAGAAHGGAVFVYPPLLLPVGLFALVLYLARRPRSLRAMAPLPLGAAAGVAAAAVFFLHRGVETAREVLDRRDTYVAERAGLEDELGAIADFVSAAFVLKYAAAALLLSFLLRRHPLGVLLLLLLPLAVIPPNVGAAWSANAYAANFALLAPAVALLLPRGTPTKRLLYVVWLPALLAGLVTDVTSANSAGVNVAIGFFPGALVTAVLLAEAIARTADGRTWRSAAAVAGVALFVGTCSGLQYVFVYRDGSLTHLTARVASGPYAGLWTTPRKRDFLTQLDRDLSGATGRGCSVFYYYRFPAGYLLGHGGPVTNATWLRDVTGPEAAAYQRGLLSYFAAHGKPDVVVRVTRVLRGDEGDFRPQYRREDPLERLFGGYAVVVERDEYMVSRRGAGCG